MQRYSAAQPAAVAARQAAEDLAQYARDLRFDALIFGYYKDGKLQYVARTRNGFTPSSREQLFKKLKPLEINQCPFANLPEARSGSGEQG